MTSLYSLFVARGLEVPEIDPRIISHVDVREVVSDDDRPAAPADDSLDSIAPVMASIEPSGPTSGDGTESPT